MIELWHEWNSVQSFKVRVVLAEKGLAWREHRVELLNFDHLQPEYLALNPNGVVPTLVHDDCILPESTIICQYLEDAYPAPALMTREPYGRAKARMWLKLFDDAVHPALRQLSFELLYRPYLARMPRAELESRLARHPSPVRAQRFRSAAGEFADKSAIDEAVTSIRNILIKMAAELRANEWLGGMRYSLADVAMSPLIDRLDHLGMMALLKPYPEVERWSDAVLKRPAMANARSPDAFRLPLILPASHQWQDN